LHQLRRNILQVPSFLDFVIVGKKELAKDNKFDEETCDSIITKSVGHRKIRKK